MSNDRSKSGFIRAMARELLVHNSQVNDVDTAIKLAEDFMSKTDWDNTHTRAKGYGSVE